MKANEILTTLDIFINSSYQKIMIDGNWGIGKTKYVRDFLEDHPNSCYVSLFGKRDIESILQEIYFKIIEKAPRGKLKKYYRKITDRLNNLDVSFAGISLSIPLIENIYNSLNKELGKKDTYLIIFDDFERKHDCLDIKEILGLIDSFSKMDNIKTVLIASTIQLEEDKNIFIKYKEKGIDRTYRIDKYADEAPMEILGEQSWKVINRLVENHKFNNLRTFEKTDLFIKEVIQILGESIFSEKFTKDDLVKMCFATVFFYVEHNGEMKLLDPGKKSITEHYTNGDNGIVDYLCVFILKNSLNNEMSKLVFYHIRSWYEKGSYNRENIISLIDTINRFEKKPNNFFSSQEEVVEIISHSRDLIRTLDGTENLVEFVSELGIAMTWCDILSIDFGFDNEEIVTALNKNIDNSIDIEKTISQNEISTIYVHIDSRRGSELITMINTKIKAKFIIKLLSEIQTCFINKLHSEYFYIEKLTDTLSVIAELKVRNKVLEDIKCNNFFFPIPAGKISENTWFWCYKINNLIKIIERQWEIENYYIKFKTYVEHIGTDRQDKMLLHRLKQLN